MTKERREEVVLVALVASVVIHLGLVFLVKSQVMIGGLPSSAKAHSRESMRVVKRVERPEPVRIESLPDLKALRDAPADMGAKSVPNLAAPSPEQFAANVSVDDVGTPPVPEKVAATVFDARLAGADAVPVAPITRIETPKAAAADKISAPEFSVSIARNVRPQVPSVPALSVNHGQTPGLGGISGTRGPQVKFTPPAEVVAKVDEKIVAAEKSAVRELVDAEEAEDLVKFVNVTMTAAQGSDGWRYFKVMMVPRANLQVVPKDVVIVIDGSGSIGKDRFSRCRAVAKRILRSALNTGDRFNLVVFRNAFSYAFRTWRPCDAESFAAGERWLARETAHGRTDVFSTISSVLTLPRDPARPLVALVVTDGDANAGVSDTAEILSKFTALNDGLVSVYMYGVKSSANRELIDVLTHGNRGESFVFEGWRWNTGEGMEALSDRFRDPVLSDLRVVFTSATKAEAYPTLLRNLYRGDTLSFVGRVPASIADVAFSLKGLNGADAYEGFFKLPFATAPNDPTIVSVWKSEQAISRKLAQ